MNLRIAINDRIEFIGKRCTAKMGKAEENKKKKRGALLSEAFSLFMNKGIANTTISDITERAGVGKGTFYFYFKDKEDLIEKLVAQKAQQLFAHALGRLRARKGYTDMSAEDKLVFIADDLVQQLIKDSKLLRLINKNLNYGIYKNALTRMETQSDFDFLSNYYELIEQDGSKWKEPLLMLYTIVELVSSTCHSIILEGQPMDYDSYKPYLFACIRSIMAVFRIEPNKE